MSGSIKYMVYSSDAGNPYAVRIDESNGNALGFADYTGSTALIDELPRNIKMRYITAQSVDPTLPSSRRFPVGSLTADAWTSAGGFIANGITYRITGSNGEKRRIPFPQDTGLTDGTAE